MDWLSRFLFWYRNTPQQTTGVSPTQLLMERRLRSALDLVHPDLASRVAKAQAYQKKTHDKHARSRVFKVGDTVFHHHRLLCILGSGPHICGQDSTWTMQVHT